MRVLVTGGTGFVGAWSAKALADDGHDVRLLVRRPDRIATVLDPLGVKGVEHAIGDMTDGVAVRAAMDGCEAVLHCAAVVSNDRREADAMIAANLRGAETVLGAAVACGADPVVHVSSIAALFDPVAPVMRTDVTASGAGAYGRSKASVENFARSLQAAGAPVTITYPGMVLGPSAGPAFGEAAQGVEQLLKMGVIPTRDGAWLVVDVRDVAAVHSACMVAGQGPRRYLCGGRFLPMRELAPILRRLTGRSLPILPIPGIVLREIGRLVDIAARVVPIETVFTRGAMEQFTRMTPSDDRGIHDELGIVYRPVTETFADTVVAMVAEGRLTAKQAGSCAS
jgi:dihydroflavonol-4-reductase